MNKETLIKHLQAIMKALDDVETHGRSSMGNLLGSINLIDNLIGELDGEELNFDSPNNEGDDRR